MKIEKSVKDKIVDKFKEVCIIKDKETCELKIKITDGNVAWIEKKIILK